MSDFDSGDEATKRNGNVARSYNAMLAASERRAERRANDQQLQEGAVPQVRRRLLRGVRGRRLQHGPRRQHSFETIEAPMTLHLLDIYFTFSTGGTGTTFL